MRAGCVRAVVGAAIRCAKFWGVRGTWQGTSDRAWIAWHCVKRYGSFLSAVCDGSSHCRAEASGEVVYLDQWPACQERNDKDASRRVSILMTDQQHVHAAR